MEEISDPSGCCPHLALVTEVWRAWWLGQHLDWRDLGLCLGPSVSSRLLLAARHPPGGPSTPRGHTTRLRNWCPRACGTSPLEGGQGCRQVASTLTSATAKAPTYLKTWKHRLQTKCQSRRMRDVCWTPVLFETYPLHLSNPGTRCWYPHVDGGAQIAFPFTEEHCCTEDRSVSGWQRLGQAGGTWWCWDSRRCSDTSLYT